MKTTLNTPRSLLIAALLALPLAGFTADETKAAKPKPYPLDKCVVSGEKLGDHGKPYVFIHEGQEIKLCCKDCVKDFKADPAKYLKQIEEANKGKK